MSHIIQVLRSQSSTLEKQNSLDLYTTPMECKMFQWAYNPTKTYGLHFDYIDFTRLGQPTEEMFILLNQLASRDLTGNAARMTIDYFAAEHGDLIKLICNKDLDCGVSATTLNNVFGQGFIPSFDIQLAKEEDIDKLIFPILAQLKYNGARVIALIEDGVVTLKSRGGHEFSYPRLADELKVLQNCMLDGELTIGDSANEDHTKVSGMVNSAIKGTPIKDTRLVYNIFDIMELNEFNMQKCNIPYDTRLKAVAHTAYYLKQVKSDSMIALARTTEIANKEKLLEIYNGLLVQGYEGLILKYKTGKYTFKKNKTWIKMKAADTADLTCVGYNEGKDKYEGMIGSLRCQGLIDGKIIEVDVAGLTDAERSKSPQYYLGKVIEVKYNKVIHNSLTGACSLFLPRFIQVRMDK